MRKVGRKQSDTSWEPLEYLKKMKPYVLKLVKNYDEKMKAMASGLDVRPLTVEEVRQPNNAAPCWAAARAPRLLTRSRISAHHVPGATAAGETALGGFRDQ